MCFFVQCIFYTIFNKRHRQRKRHLVVTVYTKCVKNKQASIHSTRCHCVLRDRRRKIRSLYKSERSASVVPFVERTSAMQKIQDIFLFFSQELFCTGIALYECCPCCCMYITINNQLIHCVNAKHCYNALFICLNNKMHSIIHFYM